MASIIFLGGLFGAQIEMRDSTWEKEIKSWRGTGLKAAISKGNIIEGIEAKA